jgi:hypothetical protein
MNDFGHGCTETSDDCTLHNLHCGYPNCAKGKRDAANKPKVLGTVTLPELAPHMEYVARPKAGYLHNGDKCCDGMCDGGCLR